MQTLVQLTGIAYFKTATRENFEGFQHREMVNVGGNGSDHCTLYTGVDVSHCTLEICVITIYVSIIVVCKGKKGERESSRNKQGPLHPK
jgi:hypothetical protein